MDGFKTLWSDSEKKRHFLIPDSLQLPPGEYQLRTPTGKKRFVDPDALKNFEVSEEEADTWLKEELGDVMRQLGAGLRNTFYGKSHQHQEKNEPKGPGDKQDEEKKKSLTPGLDLLADMTGTSRESLTGDYQAIGKALRAYMDDIASTIGSSVSGDPKKAASAQERMAAWIDTLRKHDIDVPDQETGSKNTDDVADQTKDFTTSSDTPHKHHNAESDPARQNDPQSMSEEQHNENKGAGIDDSLRENLEESAERMKQQLRSLGNALQRLAEAGKKGVNTREHHQKPDDYDDYQ